MIIGFVIWSIVSLIFLGLTRDLNDFNRAKDVLAENNITYYEKTNTITNPGRHHSVPFINMSAAYQYYLYVKRKDYDFA